MNTLSFKFGQVYIELKYQLFRKKLTLEQREEVGRICNQIFLNHPDLQMTNLPDNRKQAVILNYCLIYQFQSPDVFTVYDFIERVLE